MPKPPLFNQHQPSAFMALLCVAAIHDEIFLVGIESKSKGMFELLQRPMRAVGTT